MRNYINQTLVFSGLLLIFLLALYYVPDGATIGDIPLKKMDILSDVRKQSPELVALPDSVFQDTTLFENLDTLANALADSLLSDNQNIGPFPPVDPSLFGKIVEDYSFEQSGLNRFFSAIDSIKYGRTVRIAWYGDSFVEGDILLGDLRDTLQTLWGGQGVGFVPITSEVAQFKRSFKHHFHDWNTFSVVKKSEVRPPIGLNGYAYQPKVGADIVYEGANYFKHTKAWTEFKIFYTATKTSIFEWLSQDKKIKTDILAAKNNDLGVWKYEGNYPGIRYLGLKFPEPENLLLYGVTLESGPGVYIDNFSIRGNSGGPLKLLKPNFIRQFDAIQQYDLIVLQVGLNAVTNSLNNIRWYEAELDRTFDHLSKCFPDKTILIVSVGDRSGKNGTEYATMLGVPAIAGMQRDLARKHGFLFLDLFNLMGGEGSMIEFVNHRPRLANTDYTHLTHEGGKVLGMMLVDLLQKEQNRWRQEFR